LIIPLVIAQHAVHRVAHKLRMICIGVNVDGPSGGAYECAIFVTIWVRKC